MNTTLWYLSIAPHIHNMKRQTRPFGGGKWRKSNDNRSREPQKYENRDSENRNSGRGLVAPPDTTYTLLFVSFVFIAFLNIYHSFRPRFSLSIPKEDHIKDKVIHSLVIEAPISMDRPPSNPPSRLEVAHATMTMLNQLFTRFMAQPLWISSRLSLWLAFPPQLSSVLNSAVLARSPLPLHHEQGQPRKRAKKNRMSWTVCVHLNHYISSKRSVGLGIRRAYAATNTTMDKPCGYVPGSPAAGLEHTGAPRSMCMATSSYEEANLARNSMPDDFSVDWSQQAASCVEMTGQCPIGPLTQLLLTLWISGVSSIASQGRGMILLLGIVRPWDNLRTYQGPTLLHYPVLIALACNTVYDMPKRNKQSKHDARHLPTLTKTRYHGAYITLVLAKPRAQGKMRLILVATSSSLWENLAVQLISPILYHSAVTTGQEEGRQR
ncbi:hypothetical protein ACRALDRAFT_213538 [Sodiomyces alcalophilus JCM 7366]|uniref:uncharacterized protein n=1 Tax=Sodiomyces alcalophilus JCM 7366 TaxID=591952 RepID=UPI0039B4D090